MTPYHLKTGASFPDLDGSTTVAPRIELRQLRYFLAVAQELNFTRAAERIGIAQPPLSQQIANLEHQLGVVLFNRTRREVTLSEEGKVLIDWAERIVSSTAMAAYAVRAVAKGYGGPLRVGAVISSLYTIFPHLIPEFEAKFSAVDLQIQEMVVTQQLEALRQDRLDVGILRGPFPQADVNWVTLIKEPYVAAVPSTSALASQASVTVDALLEQPLIRVRYSTNREYSRQMFEYLLSQGRTLDIVREVADTHTLLAMVAAGAGVSFVPKSFRHIAINNVSYVPIDDESPTTAVQAVWRKDTLSPAAKNFVDLAVEITRDM